MDERRKYAAVLNGLSLVDFASAQNYKRVAGFAKGPGPALYRVRNSQIQIVWDFDFRLASDYHIR